MLDRALAALTFATRVAVIASGALLVAVVAGEVVFRYAVQQSMIFADELARYLFIWATFLAASLALRRGQHIGLEIGIHERFRLIRRLVQLLVAIFLIVLIVTSAQLVPAMWAQRSTTLEISMGWVFLALPVGAGLMLLQLVALVAGRGADRR